MSVPVFDQGSLDFVADDMRAGFRLHELQALNWGTFDGRICSYPLNGYNSLLTGNIGSGKSTLVDALTTLLVQPRHISYNKAAGAAARERNLRSYVLGHYKSEHNEETGSTCPVALRDTNSYSVLLARFCNEGFDRTLTLAQVFWFTETSGKPLCLYVTAEKALSIREHFCDFGNDIKTLRKQLRELGCELHADFKSYGAWFRRRMGIGNEQAMNLFHQTMSLKSVDNLTDFVRQHMLEPADTRDSVNALLEHYDNLNQTHQTLLAIRRQVDMLEPLSDAAKRYRQAEKEHQDLFEIRDALHPWFATRKLELLQARQEQLEKQLEQCRTQAKSRYEQRQACFAEQTRLEQAIRDNGGNRLQQLAHDIQTQRDLVASRKSKEREYERQLQILQEPVPPDESAFLAQQERFHSLLQTQTAELQECFQRLQQCNSSLQDTRNRRAALTIEIESLMRRPSNIDAKQANIRDGLCRELGLPTSSLPFAGELLQVREQEKDWEGAIERLLRSFGLSLLVPESHYRAVSERVNEQPLHARLVYYLVKETSTPAPCAPLHPQSLIHKLQLHPSAPCRDWVGQQLRRRFDLACCEDMEQFRREPRALTRQGQFKESSGRHEKDDRRRMDDRSQYVLGWNNEDKLHALRAARNLLVQQEQELEQQIGQERQLQARCEKLQAYTRYEEMDWRAPAKEQARLEEEHAQLLTASNVLGQLQQQLAQARERWKQADAAYTETVGRQQALDSRLQDTQGQMEKERAAAALLTLPEPGLQSLQQECERVLGGREITVESCFDCEQEVRQKLQTRMDGLSRKLQQLGMTLTEIMSRFKQTFPSEARDLDASLDALPEYEHKLQKLLADDLPRFESKFKEMLNSAAIDRLAGFHAQLQYGRNCIQDKISRINESLHDIDYNPGRYIRLQGSPSADPQVRAFMQDLKACTEDSISGDLPGQSSESRFALITKLLDRMRGRPDFRDEDARWLDKVTDVRKHFVFSASERWRADDTEHEHYADSSGKSGGQKEKLAYTTLAASLAYQFGLQWNEVRSNSFRFVVIDEAFGRGSDESAQYGLELFRKLNLQLLIVTPLQKIETLAPYVFSVGLVTNNDGCKSELHALTMQEFWDLKSSRQEPQT